MGVNKIVKHHSNPGKSFVAFFLRSGSDYRVYVRTYKTFIDYLSQIGGIWKVIYLVGAFLVIPINTKLLSVAISNDLFNLIHPKRTERVEKENYEFMAKRSTTQNPNKVIEAYGKNPLECKIAINYYKYERHKGMRFTVKEAFYDVFFMCCKTKNMLQEEKVFLEGEKRLYNRLNISVILNFSKQYHIMKRALLGSRSSMIEFSHKYAIHYNKIENLNRKYHKYIEYKDFHPVDLALIKEKYFISGMRGMKNKVGGLNQKTDLNLINLFNFDKKQMGRYFSPYLDLLETRYPGIKHLMAKKDEED
jgi:hypothetical protein